MALIRREILISHEVLCTKSCMCYQFFFFYKKDKKEAFQNTDFSRLKSQLTENRIDTACFVMIFQVSTNEGIGK